MMSPLYVPEAVTSSGVENIITTNESVYEARLLKEDEISPQDKEVMHYVHALGFGAGLLQDKGFLATNQFTQIQNLLEPSKGGIRKLPGTKLANPKTGIVHYTPPDNEETIRTLLKNFEDYYNEKAPAHEVFARAAILHYQFEAIHPFYDGNGRTGRILIPLYFTAQGLLDAPLLFVSRYILANRDDYYGRLRSVSYEGEWKEWVLYMLKAFESQAQYTLEILQKINFFKRKLEKRLEEIMGHSYARNIADFLYAHPFFTQAEFQDALDVSYATSLKYLQIMVDNKEKVVIRRKQTGRNRYIYACPEYIVLLKNS
jgi:Fic family protein